MKRLIRGLFWFFALFLLVVAGMYVGAFWLRLQQRDAWLLSTFDGQPIRPRIHRYAIGDRRIRFMESSPSASDSLPVVVFVHGAPASLAFFNGFFQDTSLVNHIRLVAVDRPGYGESDFGRVETSVVKQAELLQPLLERYRETPFLLLVGSSYGGALVARLAMTNPRQVAHVVFVSSALGPGLEYTFPISYWIDEPPLRWIIPQWLLNANDEKLAHRRALEELLPDWGRIRAGVTFLHGQRDELVYPSNVEFARKRLVNARVKEFILPESRHDLVINKREYIADVIRKVLAAHPPKGGREGARLAGKEE